MGEWSDLRIKWANATAERADLKAELDVCTAELERLNTEFAESMRLLNSAEETVVARTLWAQQIDRERQALAARLKIVGESRWVRLGRKLGVGPKLR